MSSNRDTKRNNSLALSKENNTMIDRLFQSGDSTTALLREQLFKSTDSTTFLSNYMKSGDAFRSSESQLNKAFGTSEPPSLSENDSAFLASLVRHSSGSLSPTRTRQASTSSLGSGKFNDMFTSRDWTSQFAPKHVDIDVNAVFRSETSDKSQAVSTAIEAPPTSKFDWEALYESKLPPPVAVAPPLAASSTSWEAASALVSIKPQHSSGAASSPITSQTERGSVPYKTTTTAKRQQASSAPKQASPRSSKYTKKRSRGGRSDPRDPEKKEFVDFTDKDVLLGRGGRTNHHSGNKRYLDEKDRIQERYLAANKEAKTVISQELVDVVHAWGGRFLKLDDEANRWYEVPNIVARKKASQTLREVNTPEERAAKRAKYHC